MATNKIVFFLIGILLTVLGISMLAPYLLQIILNEVTIALSASFVTIFVGILFLANLEKEFKLSLNRLFYFHLWPG